MDLWGLQSEVGVYVSNLAAIKLVEFGFQSREKLKAKDQGRRRAEKKARHFCSAGSQNLD